MVKQEQKTYKNFCKRLEKDKKFLNRQKVEAVLIGNVQDNLEFCQYVKKNKRISKILNIQAFVSSPEYITADKVDCYDWKSTEWLSQNPVDLIIINTQRGEYDITQILIGMGMLDKSMSVFNNNLADQYCQENFYKLYLEKIKPIGGFLSCNESRTLYNRAKETEGKGAIVEIGSYLGKSTTSLAFGSKAGKGFSIYSVDPHEYSPEWSYVYNYFIQNLKNAKVDDIVINVKKYSKDAAKDFDKPVELIFIDGLHTYDGIKEDFEAWSSKVVEGGYMVFHDRFWPGPFRFLIKIIFSSHFKNIEFYDTIMVAQKVRKNTLKDKIKAFKRFQELVCYTFKSWDYFSEKVANSGNYLFIEQVREFGSCSKIDEIFLNFIVAISKKRQKKIKNAS